MLKRIFVFMCLSLGNAYSKNLDLSNSPYSTLNNVKQIYKYLKLNPHATLMILVMDPDVSEYQQSYPKREVEDTDIYFKDGGRYYLKRTNSTPTTLRIPYEKVCNEYGECFWGNPIILKRKLGLD